MENKIDLKGGGIAKENIKNSENFNDDIEKEVEMAKKRKKCPSGTRRSKSGKSCVRKKSKKRKPKSIRDYLLGR